MYIQLVYYPEINQQSIYFSNYSINFQKHHVFKIIKSQSSRSYPLRSYVYRCVYIYTHSSSLLIWLTVKAPVVLGLRRALVALACNRESVYFLITSKIAEASWRTKILQLPRIRIGIAPQLKSIFMIDYMTNP